jgi:hypothetical protein
MEPPSIGLRDASLTNVAAVEDRKQPATGLPPTLPSVHGSEGAQPSRELPLEGP